MARRIEFIKSCHEGMTGGHRAFRATLEQVRRRGFSSGWRQDVQRYCRQCQNCFSYHRGHLPRSGPLQPMLTGSILERCHVDITGPHPQTPRGSKYILTCVDSFSKWAESFALPNREARTVARILVEQVFCRLGTPVALLTDNAGELEGRLMQEICQLLEIDKQRTRFYRPETNSVAERFHATLNSTMGRMVSDQQEWDLLLPHVMAAYRASVHQSLSFGTCLRTSHVIVLIMTECITSRSHSDSWAACIASRPCSDSMLTMLFGQHDTISTTRGLIVAPDVSA